MGRPSRTQCISDSVREVKIYGKWPVSNTVYKFVRTASIVAVIGADVHFGLAYHCRCFSRRAAQHGDDSKGVAGALENSSRILEVLGVDFQPHAIAATAADGGCHRDFTLLCLGSVVCGSRDVCAFTRTAHYLLYTEEVSCLCSSFKARMDSESRMRMRSLILYRPPFYYIQGGQVLLFRVLT